MMTYDQYAPRVTRVNGCRRVLHQCRNSRRNNRMRMKNIDSARVNDDLAGINAVITRWRVMWRVFSRYAVVINDDDDDDV